MSIVPRLATVPLLALLATACEERIPLSTVDDGSNATEAWADGQGRRTEAFAYGGNAKNEVVDYLFVLDDSVSMKAVIERVRKALLELDRERWPAEARVAFMTTLPGQPGRLSRPHPTVEHRHSARFSPGFLKLVSEEGFAAARNKVPGMERKLRHPGCDAWFRPGDTNVEGLPCMVAHTQTAMAAYQAEAGLVAVDQWLDKNAGTPVFRPGASVNVVFVSDTHDPGLPSGSAEALLDLQPTASQLVEHILEDNPVSSVRFHAIAPERECVEQWVHFGPTYYQAAEETGGAILDVCEATDYRALLESVIDRGATPTRPVFGLAVPPEEVEEVRVDGSLRPFQRHRSLPVVTVDLPGQNDNALPTLEHRIEITYRAPLKPVVTPPVAAPAGR
ncbi:MAG: hypothetical protein H6736_17615 [Alphaproteobacteria bacterium]|nr:hypothetical protein [Alphaproteobacteria bacterium]